MGTIADQLAQRIAETSRLPSLLGQVVPELVRARLRKDESLVACLARQARQRSRAPALLFEQQRITFGELDALVDRFANWLAARGVRAGDVVALFGPSSAGYVVALLGASRLGVTAALIGAELSDAFLESTLDRLTPRAVLVERESGLASRVPERFHKLSFSIDPELPAEPADSGALAASSDRSHPPSSHDFAYVYTSGTTGPTKAARVSHRRALLAATAFGRLVHRLGPGDVLYCPLPLHHASALLLGLGACLVTGATLALRPRFSATAFWSDVRGFGATAMLYIGELPHALLAQPPSEHDREHSLRVAIGNGLRPELWEPFRERFGIEKIHEFYAATEFPGAIVNITGKSGSVGHIVLERLRGYRLVQVDLETGELVRDRHGRAIECAAEEPGELVLRLKAAPDRETGDYDGYVGVNGDGTRIARDLFDEGDLYCRSGDLLRRDRSGHYWFVDRLGDSFRFKGQNVSSREVESFLARCPGVRSVAVVGVRVSGVDGQPPLATLSVTGEFTRAAFEERVAALPSHARPCFVRLVREFAMTESMKVKKRSLGKEGLDPERITDPLWFRNGSAYEPLTPERYADLVAAKLRF